jgi:hypothetical protein
VIDMKWVRSATLVIVAFLLSTAIDARQGVDVRQRKPSSESAEPVDPPGTIEMPMELLANRPLIRIPVNDGSKFGFLVDPLAKATLVDGSLVELLKLKPQAAPDGTTAMSVDLGIGPQKVTGVPVQVVDTTHMVPELGPAARPRGVLSPVLWKDQLVTIAFSRWRFRTEPGALPAPNDRNIFPLQPSSQDLVVPLKVDGQTLLCQIDPLFPGGLVLPSQYLTQITLDGKPVAGPLIQTRRTVVKVSEAKLATQLMLATYIFDAPRVMFGNVGDTAIVGTEWLRDFSITYDMTNHRARLDRGRDNLNDDRAVARSTTISPVSSN